MSNHIPLKAGNFLTSDALAFQGLQWAIHNFWDWCCHLYSSFGSDSTIADFYMSFYLELCTWPDVISRLMQKEVCNGNPDNDKTSVRERNHELYTGV
jgi:hypothetical protein